VNKGIWWANKEVVKVGFAENYFYLIPAHHPLVSAIPWLKTLGKSKKQVCSLFQRRGILESQE